MAGSIRNSPVTKILVDPVNNGVGLNVFSGTPVGTPTQIAVAVTDWSAGTVVMTQDGADGLVGGSSAPSYGLQLGFLNSGTFVAVSASNPLPVSGGGGGGNVTIVGPLDGSGNVKVAQQGTVTVGGTVAVSGTVETIPAAPTTSFYSQAPISFNASGDNTVVAGSAGKTIRVMRAFFVNADGSTTTHITIKDSTPTSFSGAFPLIPAGSFSGDGDGDPLFITASGKGFVINSSAAVQISGTVWYTIS